MTLRLGNVICFYVCNPFPLSIVVPWLCSRFTYKPQLFVIIAYFKSWCSIYIQCKRHHGRQHSTFVHNVHVIGMLNVVRIISVLKKPNHNILFRLTLRSSSESNIEIQHWYLLFVDYIKMTCKYVREHCTKLAICTFRLSIIK